MSSSHATQAVTYQKWSSGYGRSWGEPYGEVEARRRYEAREGFMVLLGDPVRPAVVVEVHPGRVSVLVEFLDELCRPTLRYVFVPGLLADPELLLMVQERRSAYVAGMPMDQVVHSAYSSGRFFDMSGSGSWYLAARDADGVETETRGVLAAEQVGELVERFPVFGDWSGLVRRRELEPDPFG